MKKTEPDPLRELLHTWRDLPAPDSNLGARVREGLRSRVAASDVPATRRAWFALDRTVFRLACACVGAGILLGIATAEWKRARARSEMPDRYLRWINPELDPRTRSARS